MGWPAVGLAESMFVYRNPRNIGVIFDNELSLKSQVSKLCQVAFFNIRRIRSIRDCLTQHATELLIHFLVISRLDYGNGLLYGVPGKLLDKLQRVQNVAARVVVKASRYDHITPILKSLHWLPIRYRTEYKLLLLTFKSLHHLAPSYLTDLIQLYHPTRTLRSSSDSLLTHAVHVFVTPVIVPSTLLRQNCGTIFHSISVNADLCTVLTLENPIHVLALGKN